MKIIRSLLVAVIVCLTSPAWADVLADDIVHVAVSGLSFYQVSDRGKYMGSELQVAGVLDWDNTTAALVPGTAAFSIQDYVTIRATGQTTTLSQADMGMTPFAVSAGLMPLMSPFSLPCNALPCDLLRFGIEATNNQLTVHLNFQDVRTATLEPGVYSLAWSAVRCGGEFCNVGWEGGGGDGNKTVTRVPEPASLTLTLLGLGAVGLLGRARRQRTVSPEGAAGGN